MITILSSEHVGEDLIQDIFKCVLELTLSIYHYMNDYELEPMGSQQDMLNNMPKITGSILRACRTYYETPEEQLIQIISSITVNHYLENGNKRTAVSAGVLYLIAYNNIDLEPGGADIKWHISKINDLKVIADSFAKAGDDFELVKDKMIQYARQKIFKS